MPKPASKAAETYQEPDFTRYLDKPMTSTQEHFHDWVLTKTGYDPATAKTKAASFAEGIRIGTALRGAHQASPENQDRLAEAKAAREAAEAEEATPVAKPTKAAKATPAAAAAKAAPATKAARSKASKAAPAVVEPEPEAEVEETKPVVRRRAPAKKAAPAARRSAVVIEESPDEAPF